MVWMFVCLLPKFIYYNFNAQYDGVTRWGLWVVLKSWGNCHKWDSCLIRNNPERVRFHFHHVRIHREVCDPEEGPHTAFLAPWTQTSASRTLRNKCLLLRSKGGKGKQWQTLFSCPPKSLQTVTAAMKLKDAPWKKSYDKPRQCIKKQRHHFDKGSYSQSYGFSSSYVRVWELGHKEGWMRKNWWFWIWCWKRLLRSPLDCKEVVNQTILKGNQPWIFIGRTDAEAEASVLWLPDAKSWLTGRDPDAGKDWRQKEKGVTEDEMVR